MKIDDFTVDLYCDWRLLLWSIYIWINCWCRVDG